MSRFARRSGALRPRRPSLALASLARSRPKCPGGVPVAVFCRKLRAVLRGAVLLGSPAARGAAAFCEGGVSTSSLPLGYQVALYFAPPSRYKTALVLDKIYRISSRVPRLTVVFFLARCKNHLAFELGISPVMWVLASTPNHDRPELRSLLPP